MTKGLGLGISAVWFKSKNICEVIPYSFISDPEKVSSKLEVEFKSSDIFLRKGIVNSNVVNSVTYNKIKGN